MAWTPQQKAANKMIKIQGAGNLYSHSALDTFQSCGFKWYGSYALGLKDAPNYHLALGHLLHAVGSDVVRAVVEGREVNTDGIEAWIAAARKRYSSAGGYDVNEAALVPEAANEYISRNVLAIVDALPESFEQLIVEGVMLQPLPLRRGAGRGLDLTGCEELLATEGQKDAYFKVLNALEAAGCNGFQVKPDLTIVTADSVVFRDWKTNGNNGRKTIRDIVGQYTTQVRRYAAVGRRRFTGRAVRGDIQSFEYGPPAEVDLTEERLDETAREVVKTIHDISAAGKQGVAGFPKAVGNTCRFCHLAKMTIDDQPVCPEGKAYRESKGWNKDDEQDAMARIAAEIHWEGDGRYRAKILMNMLDMERAEQAAKAKGDPVVEAPAVDPITEEVSTWTPQEAVEYARDVVYQERLAATARGMRPFIERYVELHGPIVLEHEETRGLPAGTWEISGGRSKVGWTSDAGEVVAAAVAGGFDPKSFVRQQVDPKELAKLSPEVAETVGVAVQAALEQLGIPVGDLIRTVPNVSALDGIIGQPEIFEKFKGLRVEEETRKTLRFTPSREQPPSTAQPAPAEATRGIDRAS